MINLQTTKETNKLFLTFLDEPNWSVHRDGREMNLSGET